MRKNKKKLPNYRKLAGFRGTKKEFLKQIIKNKK